MIPPDPPGPDGPAPGPDGQAEADPPTSDRSPDAGSLAPEAGSLIPDTGPIAPRPPVTSAPPVPAVPGPGQAQGAQSATDPPVPDRLGASTFTIEGRAAPALFVVGWLATLLGLGFVVVGILSSLSGVLPLLVGLVLLSIGLVAGAGSQSIERRARGELAYRGPSPILVFLATIPISLLAVTVVAIPMSLVGIPLDGPFAALASVSVQAVIYVTLVRLLVVDTGALDWAAMGIRRLDRAALSDVIGGAAWALPVIVATIPVAAILQAIFPVTPISPLPPTGTALGFAISLLAGVVVAPFGEEILFRAFATTAWATALGATRGLIQAALLFAFAHVLTVSGTSAGDAFGQAVVAFGGRIPVALALGWIFLRRRSMWASYGLHATFNAILLVVAEVAARSV